MRLTYTYNKNDCGSAMISVSSDMSASHPSHPFYPFSSVSSFMSFSSVHPCHPFNPSHFKCPSHPKCPSCSSYSKCLSCPSVPKGPSRPFCPPFPRFPFTVFFYPPVLLASSDCPRVLSNSFILLLFPFQRQIRYWRLLLGLVERTITQNQNFDRCRLLQDV